MRQLVAFYCVLFTCLSPGMSQVTVDFDVNDREGCGTLQAQFTDLSSSTEGPIETWFWELGNGIQSALSSPGRVFTEPGSYEICLTVEDIAGNSSKLCKDGYITIYELPKIEFTADPADGCIPMTVAFESLTQTDNPIEAMIWDLGGDVGVLQGGPELNSVEGKYLAEDEYSVSLTVRDDKGCISSLSKPGLIKAGTLDEPIVEASDPLGCTAPHLTTLTLTDALPGVEYTWDFGNGATYTGTEPPEQEYNAPGAYQISIVATDTVFGCRDTFHFDGLVNVGLQGLPSVDKSVSCTRSPFVFTDNAYTGQEDLLWDFGDGSTSSEISPVYRYDQAGCYTVRLTKIYSGCQTTTVLDTCVEVVDKPAIALEVDRSSTCILPAEFNFDYTGPALENIRWDVDGNPAAMNVSQLTITTDSIGWIAVEMRGKYLPGCPLQILDSVYVGKLELELPELSVSGCIPTTATIDAPTSNGFELVSWTWTLFTDPPQVSTSEAPSFQVNGAGSFDLQLVASTSEGCTDTVTAKSSLSAGIPPSFTMSSDLTTTCADSAVQFRADFDTPFSTTSWTFGDGETSQQKNPLHEFQDTGVFTVILEAGYNGCTTTDSLVQHIQIPGPVSKYMAWVDCSSKELYLTDESIGADEVEYEVIFNDTTINSSYEPDPVFQLINDGLYEVVQYTYNSQTGCTDTYVDSIYIGQIPLSVTLDTNSGCSPLQVQVVNSTPYVSEWIWSVPNASISNDSIGDPVLTFVQPGIYEDFSLEFVDDNGCAGSADIDLQVFVGAIMPELTDTTYVGCPEGEILLDGMGTTAIPVDNWQWIVGDTAMMSYDSALHVTSLDPGYYNLRLRVIDSLGCISTTSMDSVFHIYDPQLEFRGDTVTCLGALSRYRIIAPVDDVTYKWDFGDVATYYGPRANHTFDSLGTYEVCVSIMNAQGCDSLLCKEIRVVEFDAAFAADSVFANCPPLIVNFENLSQSATSFQWLFGDNSGISALEDPSHVYTVPGQYDVTLIAELTSKCRDTVTLFDLIQVEGPEGEFTFDLEGDCLPIEATFEGSSIDAYNYIWDFGDGKLDSTETRVLQDTAHYIFRNRGTYLPRLTLIDTLECRYTLVGLDTIHINGEFIDAGIDTSICAGENVMLDPEVKGGDVSWLPHPLINDPSQLTQSVMPEESTSFIIQGYEGDCFESDTLSVVVYEEVEIEVPDGVICVGDSIELNASGNALDFEWLVESDIPILYGANSSIVVSPEETVTYTVIGSKSICKPDTAVATVTVYGNFQYDLPEYSVIYQDEIYNIPLSIDDPTVSIEWTPGSAVSCTTCPNPVVKADSNMMLYVEFIEPIEGCVVKDSIMVRFPLSCSGTYAYMPNVFTPNGDGVNDVIRLETNKFTELVRFGVYNRWGKEIFSSNDISFEWDGTHEGEALTPGVYVYNMQLICPMNQKPLTITGDITLLR